MSVQIAVRLPEEQVQFLDRLVSEGEARSRAELVSRAVARYQRRHQALRDLERLHEEPYDEFDDFNSWAVEHGPLRRA